MTPTIPTLETPRLLLRPLELADAEQAQILFPHWEIVRYLNGIVPWPYPPDGAYIWYRDHAIPAMECGEEWHWTLRLKSSPDRLIGSISLMSKHDNNRGFWLGLPWQGQGLMTEACESVTDYWFDVLKFPALRVPKAVANTASRRISEKNGMRIIATESTNTSQACSLRNCGRSPRENGVPTSNTGQRPSNAASSSIFDTRLNPCAARSPFRSGVSLRVASS